jgi:hypothetical protein
MSFRPERPDLLFRAVVWRVGPRSAICAPCALRRGGGIAAAPPRHGSLPVFRISFFDLRFSNSCFLIADIWSLIALFASLTTENL